jgi:hypothetical protein
MLLLEQLVKAGLLLGGEGVAEGRLGFADLFLELRPHWVHDFPGPLLALADDGIDALFLVWGKAEFGLEAAQQLEPKPAGRGGLLGLAIGIAGARRVAMADVVLVPD